MKKMILLAMTCAFVAWAGFAPALTEQRTENFDTDPGWEGVANRDAPQNFGYSTDTNNAGGAALGEAGGYAERATKAWYADDIGVIDISDTALNASGKMAITAGDAGNYFVGYFNDSNYGAWPPSNFIGFRNDHPVIYAYVNSNGSSVTSEQFPTPVNLNPFTWSIVYDPDGNGGNGSATITLNGTESVVADFAAGQKDDMSDLTRFGMATLYIDGNGLSIQGFIDDVDYTADIGGDPTPTPPLTLTQISLEEDFATDPSDWIEVNSRTAPSNFGFSNTNNIGTGAGEAGGQIVRRTTFTYYAMELPSPLDSLDNAFSFEFDYKLTTAETGANVAIGFFNPDTVTNNTDLHQNPNFIIAQHDDATDLHVGLQPPPAESERIYLSPDDNTFTDQATHHVKIQYVATGQVPDGTLAAGEFGQIAAYVDGSLSTVRQANLTTEQRNADWLMTHFGIFATMNQDSTNPITFYVDNISIDYYGMAEAVNPAEEWPLFE